MPLVEVRRLAIPEVVYFRYRLFEDERGIYAELWKRTEYLAAGLPFDFVQVNLIHSGPFVVRGRVFDVAVDIRRGSPHFGRWVAAELGPGEALWIPPGFAPRLAVPGGDALSVPRHEGVRPSAR
jgi:dTDP-4-dehydrorhamnose 3,5-epimerase